MSGTAGGHTDVPFAMIRGSVLLLAALHLTTFAVLVQYLVLEPRLGFVRFTYLTTLTCLLGCSLRAYQLIWRRSRGQGISLAFILLAGIAAWGGAYWITGALLWPLTHGAPFLGAHLRAKGLLNLVLEPCLVAAISSLAVFAFPAKPTGKEPRRPVPTALVLGLIVLLSIMVDLVVPALGGS